MPIDLGEPDLPIDLGEPRYLVALSRSGSFTRATGKVLRVEMTEAGDRLVEHARRVLRQVDAAVEDMEAMAGLRAGRLTGVRRVSRGRAR